MATIRRMDLADLLAFVLIVAAAAGARVWYLNTAADNGMTSGPLRVQDGSPSVSTEGPIRGRNTGTELDVLVENLKEKNQFASRPPIASQVEETAHVAPGYPYFLSLIDRFAGDADQADQFTRWAQAGLGALTAGLYFVIALMAFRSRAVAVLAGLFCAVHPFWIVDTAAIADGTLATFLLAAVLFLGTRGGLVGGALTCLLFGLALAALALVRAALLPFSIVGLLWFLFRCREVPRGWLCGVVGFLGFFIGMAPWGVRNWEKYQEVVPIVDSTFLHAWIGNNPRATGGPMSDEEIHEVLSRGPNEKAGSSQREQILAQPSQKERMRILGEAALREIREDPAATLRRRIWAGLYYFFGQSFLRHPEGWVTDDLMVTPGQYEPLPAWLGEQLPVIFFGSTLGMLLMGVLGWRWTYGWRHAGRLLALAAIFIPLPYLLTHAEALVGPRLPLDGVFLTFAAFALACLLPGVNLSLFRGPVAVEEEEALSRRLEEEGKPHVRF